MKIVFLDSRTLNQLEEFKQIGKSGDFVHFDTTPKEKTIERIADAEIVITNKVIINKEVMDACPNLKLICIAATGMNNVDLEYAAQRQIKVKNVKGYSTQSVVQHTYALLFYMIHHCKHYDAYVKSGEYARSNFFAHLDKPFFELSGRNFGIIGLGTIGKSVAKIASAFGANVMYYSTSGKNKNAAYKHVDLKTLLQQCDVVSIHAPLNENTINLIDYQALCEMKSSAILLNTGRGKIVNETDLAKALNENRIAGAAIDVLEQEPIQADNQLLKLNDSSKILITPHHAWAGISSRKKLVEGIVANINEYLASKK